VKETVSGYAPGTRQKPQKHKKVRGGACGSKKGRKKSSGVEPGGTEGKEGKESNISPKGHTSQETWKEKISLRRTKKQRWKRGRSVPQERKVIGTSRNCKKTKNKKTETQEIRWRQGKKMDRIILGGVGDEGERYLRRPPERSGTRTGKRGKTTSPVKRERGWVTGRGKAVSKFGTEH